MSENNNDDPAEHVAAVVGDLVDEPDAPAMGATGALPGDTLNPSAVLVVKRGTNAGPWFVLDKPVTSVGRHPDSDVLLDDGTVSRRHAEFRYAHGVLEVADVGSLNGIYVNRQPVESAVLAEGDEVQIGKFRLMYLGRPTPPETVHRPRHRHRARTRISRTRSAT